MNAAALASGNLLLGSISPVELMGQDGNDWDGYGGMGDYRESNGNSWEVMSTAHAIRDHFYDWLRRT